MNEHAIRKYLQVIKRAIALIEGELGREPENTPVIEPSSAPIKHSRKEYIDELTSISDWPVAVPEMLIRPTTDEDNQSRARSVLDMKLPSNVEGLRFLDFGCGDGWITNEALSRGFSYCLGYDIQRSPKWEQFDSVSFTDRLDEIDTNSFDIIFLYDVIDHCFDPLELMGQVKRALKPGGSVYIRCHPWTAKHATHLFKQGINKAWLHLFLTWEEIRSLINQDPLFVRVETDPLTAYRYWFSEFNTKKEQTITEPVENFFFDKRIKDLIAREQKITSKNMDKFYKNMELQFVDYVLQKS